MPTITKYHDLKFSLAWSSVTKTNIFEFSILNLIEKVNFRLKWAIQNEVPGSNFIISYSILENISKSHDILFDIDRDTLLAGINRIYTLPVNERRYKFKSDTEISKTLLVVPLNQVIYNSEIVTHNVVLVVHTP